MGVCAGITRDGSRCKASVGPGKQWCYNHDPARAEQRKRNAAKGGKAKPSRELADIKTRLSGLADRVLSGEVDRSNAAVASQVLNVYLRAVSIELKIREQQELSERIEELEAMVEARKGGRYGA